MSPCAARCPDAPPEAAPRRGERCAARRRGASLSPIRPRGCRPRSPSARQPGATSPTPRSPALADTPPAAASRARSLGRTSRRSRYPAARPSSSVPLLVHAQRATEQQLGADRTQEEDRVDGAQHEERGDARQRPADLPPPHCAGEHRNEYGGGGEHPAEHTAEIQSPCKLLCRPL